MLNIKDYECGVCLDLMKDPCKLPCKHILCMQCINTIQKENHNKCPICRRIIPLAYIPKINLYLQTKIKSSFQHEYNKEVKFKIGHKYIYKGITDKDFNCHQWNIYIQTQDQKLKASEYIKRVIYKGFAKSDITCLYPGYNVICVGTKPYTFGVYIYWKLCFGTKDPTFLQYDLQLKDNCRTITMEKRKILN